MKKDFYISWEDSGTALIEAETEDEAIEIFKTTNPGADITCVEEDDQDQ